MRVTYLDIALWASSCRDLHDLCVLKLEKSDAGLHREQQDVHRQGP
jgi:hypothetical protein